MEQVVKNLLSDIEGHTCWRISCGLASGTRVNLDFGEKYTYQEGKDEDPTEYGEFGIQIEDCSWRLTHEKKIIVSTSQSVKLDSDTFTQIRNLEGTQILSAELINEFYDLVITFSEGYKIWLFTDDYSELSENYTLSCGDDYYAISIKNSVPFIQKSE